MSETQQDHPSPSGSPPEHRSDEPNRTAPLSVLAAGVSGLRNAIFPAIAAAFGTGIGEYGVLIGLGVGAAIFVAVTLGSYLQWLRLTYTIGAQDIRVESGVLSRAARSVPFERIQDVSLEQGLIPRLLGLVSVKFETGAGGGEDLSLTYLSEEQGEELRQLVRERRDGLGALAGRAAGMDTSGEASAPAMQAPDEGEVIFAMGPSRLFIFGLFEFSLAVFAVLLGLLQYTNSFFDPSDLDYSFWWNWAESLGSVITEASYWVQVASAIGGVITLLLVGSATGMIRVFLREWGFLLERTARGFRRRRGLLTRTDVVMPIHRVQGVGITTGWVRYRFGWHGLRFVSLAQDMGAASHDVAPFARINEIAPIMRIAGFDLPAEGADWRRATGEYLVDSALWSGAFYVVLAAGLGVATHIFAPEWRDLAIGIPLILAGLSIIGTFIGWRYKRHALDGQQIVAVSGVLSPTMLIARRVKLHSAEVAQGPIGRLRGYATLYLGQAGGEFAIPGIPVERAYELRRAVLDSIATKDFSQLEKA